MKTPIATLIVSLLSLSACVKGKFTADQAPRLSFCTGTDPTTGANNDPIPRTHENSTVFSSGIDLAHQWCNNWGQNLISGFDMVNRYESVGRQKPSQAVFQYIHLVTEEWLPGGGTCDGHYLGKTDGYVLEYWALPAYDTIASFRCCESRYRAERNAEIAIIDLNDLDSGDRAELNKLASPTSEVPTIIDVRLVPSDVVKRLRDKTEADKKITWNATYEYDNCHTPPQTSCGQRQCVTGGWKDSVGSGVIHVP